MPRREHSTDIGGMGDTGREPPDPVWVCPACGHGYRNDYPTCGKPSCNKAVDSAATFLNGIRATVNAVEKGLMPLDRIRESIDAVEADLAKTLYELS